MSGLPTVVCPACHTEMGLEALLGGDDARGVVAQLVSLPGPPALRRALLRYVGLFAPASQKLRWSRAETLLGELRALIEAGQFERGGRLWPAPLDSWQLALDTLFDLPTLRRPLKSHGLLLEILAGLSNRAEAQAERDDHARRAGHTPVGTPAPAPAPAAAQPRPTRNPAVAAAALAEAKRLLTTPTTGD